MFQTLRFLESVPHVVATFNSHTALFMLDTGAGGVDIIFHGRAVKKFNMLESVNPETHAHLMGIDASSEGLEVLAGFMTSCKLPLLRVLHGNYTTCLMLQCR